MNILVLGAAGMAGHTVALYFHEKGYNVTAFTTRPFPYCKSIIGNALDKEDFSRILESEEYDVIINCIGLLNQTAEDHPSLAVYLNSYLPDFIADTIKEKKARLIQMSTDCVFAGNTGPYYENSFPDGQTFYDRTKALGEVNDAKNLTFRSSIVGPDIKELGIGLFNWFMKQNGKINGFTGARWTGVTTLTLAKAMEQAIKENLAGLYNLVNGENISKYELLQLFNKHFRDNSLLIEPSDKLQLDKTLFSSRCHDFTFKIPSYEQMVVEMRQWIDNHKQLYPFYFRK